MHHKDNTRNFTEQKVQRRDSATRTQSVTISSCWSLSYLVNKKLSHISTPKYVQTLQWNIYCSFAFFYYACDQTMLIQCTQNQCSEVYGDASLQCQVPRQYSRSDPQKNLLSVMTCTTDNGEVQRSDCDTCTHELSGPDVLKVCSMYPQSSGQINNAFPYKVSLSKSSTFALI